MLMVIWKYISPRMRGFSLTGRGKRLLVDNKRHGYLRESKLSMLKLKMEIDEAVDGSGRNITEVSTLEQIERQEST